MDASSEETVAPQTYVMFEARLKKKKKGQPACLMLAWDHIPNVAAAGECEVLAEMTVFRFGGWLLSGPS